MEESKLLALHASLKASGPAGKRGGLGAGRKSAVTTGARDGLPDNPLYARFVRAGGWNPDTDDIVSAFAGKRQKFTEEEEVEDDPVADVESEPIEKKDKKEKKERREEVVVEEETVEVVRSTSGSKRKREEVSQSDSKSKSKSKAEFDVKTVTWTTVHALCVESSKGRVKVSKVQRAVVQAAQAHDPSRYGDEAAIEGLQRQALQRLVRWAKKKHVHLAGEDNKYVHLPSSSS